MPPAASFFAKKLGKKTLDFGFMRSLFFTGRCEHARAEHTANKEPYRTLYQQSASGLELLHMPMILREENSGTRQEMEQYLRKLQIPPEALNIIAQIDNPEAIRSSVSRGLGVSIMSVLAAREYLLSERLLSFELGDQGAFRKIYLCWRKDALLSPPEQKFLEFVQGRPMIIAPK